MPLPGTSPGSPTTPARSPGLRASWCGTALVVVALLTAGCGGDEDEALEQDGATSTTVEEVDEEGATSTSTTASPTSTTSTTAAPSTTTTTTGAFEGSTARVEIPSSPATEGVVSHTDLAVTSGRGEERITFGFDGALPAAVVEYARGPVREAGSGDEVAVAGAAVLSIRFEPASSVLLDGEEVTRTYAGPERVAGAGTVAEVVRTGDFEAVYEWAAGVRAEVPFRVETDRAAATITIVVPGP